MMWSNFAVNGTCRTRADKRQPFPSIALSGTRSRQNPRSRPQARADSPGRSVFRSLTAGPFEKWHRGTLLAIRDTLSTCHCRGMCSLRPRSHIVPGRNKTASDQSRNRITAVCLGLTVTQPLSRGVGPRSFSRIDRRAAWSLASYCHWLRRRVAPKRKRCVHVVVGAQT